MPAAAQGVSEEEITEERLQVLCGTHFLTSVDFLELRVDATVQSIDTLGSSLPNLLQLKLSGSSIASVRDLGTGLTNLQVLWISRCGLQDLSGLACLSNLRELFAAFNDVADLSPLGMHEALEVLDLEGNAVCEVDEVGSLWMCPELKELTLAGNPVCKEEGFSRRAVANLLPQLQVLDEVPLDAASSLPAKGCTATEFFQLHDTCDVFDIASLSDDEDEEVLSGEESEPLAAFTHPLLVEAMATLDESVPLRQELSRVVGEDEPDEDTLVLERLKEQRSKGKQRFAFCATSRQLEAPAAASDLTCGTALAGSPLSAARLRRRQHGTHSELNDDEVLPRSCKQESLRQLLRKYQTEVHCTKDRQSQDRPPTRASPSAMQDEERVIPMRPQQPKQKGEGRPCSASRRPSSAKLETGYPAPSSVETATSSSTSPGSRSPPLATGYPTLRPLETVTLSSASSPGSRRPPLAPSSLLTLSPTSPLKRCSGSRSGLSSASTSPSSRCSTPLTPLQPVTCSSLPRLQASTSFMGDPYSYESEGMVCRGAPPADGGFAGIDFSGGALLQKELRTWSALGLGLKSSPVDRPSSRTALRLAA